MREELANNIYKHARSKLEEYQDVRKDQDLRDRQQAKVAALLEVFSKFNEHADCVQKVDYEKGFKNHWRAHNRPDSKHNTKK